MRSRILLALPALTVMLALAMSVGAAAQVATLRTPGPDAEASEPPTEEVDGQEAILAFVGCLRDNGIDIPDPQFGVQGGFFAGDPEDAGIDFFSREFLDATEACQHHLEALQPEVDPEQLAEQNEQLLVFAECMRREGIDFPDPDPLRGFSIGSLRDDDGELRFDPFSTDFQSATTICSAEVGLEVPDGGGVN